MQRISLFLLALVTFCLGCGSAGNSLSSGSGSIRVGNTTAEYYMAHGGMMLVVWLKHPPSGTHGGGSGVSSGPAKMVVTGSQRYGDAPSIEWRCETTNGKTGTVTLGGQNYELAKGGMFLVDMTGDNPAVTQLTREIASIKSKAELEALAKTDAEIKKFVGEE